MPQKYRGTYQNRPNTVKIKGRYSGGHHHDGTKQAEIPHRAMQAENQKCFPAGLVLGSCGCAQRVEDIGHNLVETGHLHDEDFVVDLRAVPSEAWTQTFCLIRSYISTARRHTMDVPVSIARVFTGDPAMEPMPNRL